MIDLKDNSDSSLSQLAKLRRENPASPNPENPDAYRIRFCIGTILFVTAVTLVLMFIHHGRINGAPYHRWDWRSLPILGTYPFILPFVIPFFWGQHVYHKNMRAIRLALLLVALSTFLLTLATAMTQVQPPSPEPIAGIILNNRSSGYFNQAAQFNASGLTISQWLARYPQLLPAFGQHPRNKPPGCLLFCAIFIAAFGAGKTTALMVGFAIAALAALAVPAAYAFIAFFTGDRRAAFYGSSYLALCPCLLLIFPQFDQCYPVLTVALAILWALALDKNRIDFAAGFGLLFAVTMFLTYLQMVLVFFFAALAIMKLATDPNFRISRCAIHVAAALAGFVAFYLALWITTRFDPIATFRMCLVTHHENLHLMELRHGFGRHLPGTIPWDLYDFALGSGWISFLLLGYYLWFQARTDKRSATTRIAILCIGQFVLVAITGLIQCETARVWMFMLPMLMVPIGLVLSAWNYRARTIVYLALLLITLGIFRNMVFQLT
jgi:hypothetical protein